MQESLTTEQTIARILDDGTKNRENPCHEKYYVAFNPQAPQLGVHFYCL